jgi:hypothetical protein
MFVKIMSGEVVPDSDMCKCFRLIDGVVSADFNREGKRPTAFVTFDDGGSETYDLNGNCYLMNDSGKTVASFIVVEPDRRCVT